MLSNLKSKSDEPNGGTSGARRRSVSRKLVPCLMLMFLIASASSVNAQMPQSVPLTTDEQRKLLLTLTECEGLASEFTILAAEAQLLREARDAQARAAELFEKAATEERKARIAQEALTEQAREETKAERKKGRWNLIKGIGLGAVIGGGIVAVAALLGGAD